MTNKELKEKVKDDLNKIVISLQDISPIPNDRFIRDEEGDWVLNENEYLIETPEYQELRFLNSLKEVLTLILSDDDHLDNMTTDYYSSNC